MSYEYFNMNDPETPTNVDIPSLFVARKESWPLP